VLYVCDKDLTRLKKVRKRYPSVILTSNFQDVLDDADVDAVVIATPTKFHFTLAKQAIESGKDVLLEKPMTFSYLEAKELSEFAEKNKKIVMVDHTFLFTEAVRKLKKIIDSGEIGDIVYIDSVRVNLGLFQTDSNVAFDLGTHDVAILQYLLGVNPIQVTGVAKSFYGEQEDTFYMHLEYPGKIMCHIHISWLSPLKIRRMMVIGTKKMVVYDDVEQSEKIKIYDKGVIVEKPKEISKVEQIRVGYRSGDVYSPNLDIKEGLSVLAAEFIEAITTRHEPLSSANFGKSVINVLEKATESARKRKTIKLNGNRK
jgi:predicted dehydrogenase